MRPLIEVQHPRSETSATRFGRYRLIERLGEGGMAVVYRAVVEGPEGFSRSVVIKRIRPELSGDSRFVDMLVAEARLSALLHHPGIVQVHELGDVDGEYFLAMEHVEGRDLSDVLAECARRELPVPIGVACHLVAEAAAALDYAHNLCDASGRPLEIVHRDVSPSNLMVTRQGAMKVLDFGVARAAMSIRDERTRTGTIKGKLAYMSPEQADARPVDRRGDVFALGIVLHECLTLRRLFKGVDDLHTLRLVREASVVPPSALRDGIPPELDAIVLKMLARDVAARYLGCEEVARALERIVRACDGGATAVRRFVDELGPPAAAKPLPGRAHEPPTNPPTVPTAPIGLVAERGATLPFVGERRRSVLVPLLVAGAVAALAFAGWIGARPRVRASRATNLAPATASPMPPVLPSPPAPPPPAMPKRVQLSLRGPRGAAVTIDGRPVGTLPLEVRLPATATPRSIAVRAPGFAPWTLEVPGDRDALADVALRPADRGAPKKKPSFLPGGLADPFPR